MHTEEYVYRKQWISRAFTVAQELWDDVHRNEAEWQADPKVKKAEADKWALRLRAEASSLALRAIEAEAKLEARVK